MSNIAVKPVSWIGSSYKDFQKKSKSGIKTSTGDVKLIQRRLNAAEADYKIQLGKGKAS